MNTKTRTSLLVAGICLAALADTFGQSTFTKITTGAIVNDGGSSYGCAWGDYDNDGYIDLFVGNGWNTRNFLYRNNRDGTFTKITAGSIVTDPADSGGGVWGDYDNDGDLDLFVANFFDPKPDRLYRNEGNGTFTGITSGSIVNDSSHGNGSAWADYDRDGWLDLFVSNADRQNDLLYHNQGNGTFASVTSGPVVTSGRGSQGCAWGDFDNDGDPDLVVANIAIGVDATPALRDDFFFRNDGAGSFTSITREPIADGVQTAGVAWADYDNDGDLDLFVTGSLGDDGTGENDRLYRNDGLGNFTLVGNSGATGDGASNYSAAWGDYDNDGWIDLFITGYLRDLNRLYHNNGDGTFTQVTTGEIAADGGISVGCAWGDYDNDGFLDLFVANGAEDANQFGENNNYLYHNNGNTNGWIMVKLVGTKSNRSAIGTKVRVKATIAGKTVWQMREISGGSGFASQNDLRAHFGLKDALVVETLRVEWPSGIVQEFSDLERKRIYTLVEEPPALKAVGIGRIQLAGANNVTYEVQTSDDLTRWSRAGVVTGSGEYLDAEASTHPYRFYRVPALY